MTDQIEDQEPFFPHRKQLTQIAYMFEAEPVLEIIQEEDNFEDVTDLLFAAVDEHLDGMELICKPKFNLDDTMSSI
jgi:hypothetical protein